MHLNTFGIFGMFFHMEKQCRFYKPQIGGVYPVSLLEMERSKIMQIGLDIGSTTIKAVVLDAQGQLLFKTYRRHYSQITENAIKLLEEIRDTILKGEPASLSITGSAGMGLAEGCDIPFVQEVYATRLAANRLLPGTDVIIELGGEDAKIVFLTGGVEARMNGSCAGGTGAFIDQMATLMDITPDEMNTIAQESTKTYTIASRCGVFAKSDIQPLLNQGALKSDIAASIFYAVVNQTIAGLAQGRPIAGQVVYLGGPLTFLSQLRHSFDVTLGLTGICPENSLYYVAIGATLGGGDPVDIDQVIDRLEHYRPTEGYHAMAPLFENEDEYQEFLERHSRSVVETAQLTPETGKVFLGIDAGSTTVKLVLIDREGRLLLSQYSPNSGNPVPLVQAFLEKLYAQYPYVEIGGAAVTGYGEDLIRNVFNVDDGIVETVAHFTAARKFMPDVDFIIDIGGQDIKCFKIHNGAIDNIFLNEACSSGCGSFLQTFANALGYSVEDFANLGIHADHPVDLGSRCTVFMNSSVKQAQKDGASIENISAGLSISVVKNALYKVIRTASPSQLGQHIVVQGGTFHNDAVLRAFEQELGVSVIRPNIAGLMGAYGAALYAQSRKRDHSGIVSAQELADFTHQVQTVHCGLCSNNCQLTVNIFGGGRKYISGNRCERPVTKRVTDETLNLYEYKRRLLAGYGSTTGRRGTVGLPLGLNMLELLPFWHRFFGCLDIGVTVSPFSDREMYLKGQASIPSDTVCFPAKLLHGHVQTLLDEGVNLIFYPCMSYNFDEGLGDNHYNCPVVAYYPEVLAGNMPGLRTSHLIKDYLGLHQPKVFPEKIHQGLLPFFPDLTLHEVRQAAKAAYREYQQYMEKVRQQGDVIIQKARAQGQRIIVLAGRPYHVDPEINHGIDKLIASFGVAVITEDAVSHKVEKFPTKVLNQWTYHSRLYAAARYVGTQPDMNLVQLVSFGCGVDAITTDETRSILEDAGKIYTQIKIDEITNLGAVKIRLRSLLAAIDQREEEGR